ncbi:MAG: hypothetical protein ACK4SY_03995 [Pyrobaculum sp.]
MHKGGNILITVTPGEITIDGRRIEIGGLRPVELMLAALAYGVGIRYVDKTGEAYQMECRIDGRQIVCRARCSGEEERCIVYQTLTRGLLQLQCENF